MSDDDNVVQLRPERDPRDEQRPLHTKDPEPKKRWCEHRRTELATRARRVNCLDCGDEVDAFDVLKELASRWEWYVEGRQRAQRDSERAQKRLSALLNQEKNAKSRKRLRKKQLVEGLPELVSAARGLMGSRTFLGAWQGLPDETRVALRRLHVALMELDEEIDKTA